MSTDKRSEQADAPKTHTWRVRVTLTWPPEMTGEDVKTGVTNALKQYGARVTRVKEVLE